MVSKEWADERLLVEHRQGAELDGVHETEDGGVRPNPERQRQDRHRHRAW